jgi:hypothetical protein
MVRSRRALATFALNPDQITEHRAAVWAIAEALMVKRTGQIDNITGTRASGLLAWCS